jgi:hypothetical protein
MRNYIRALPWATIAISLALPGRAAEWPNSPDEGIDRINTIVGKINQNLVVEKLSCTDGGGEYRNCFYVSKRGPGIAFLSRRGSSSVDIIVIGDQSGMSPAGGAYLEAVMEAFDTSLDDDQRKDFYTRFLRQFSRSWKDGGTGTFQMASTKLKYLLSWNDRSMSCSVTRLPGS